MVNTKINLDKKLIAIVGPNEAGKTTLLTALESATSRRDLPLTLRSRGAEVEDGDRVVKVTYTLEDADKAAIAEFDISTVPSHLSVHRRAGERQSYVQMSPYPARNFSALAKLVDSFAKKSNTLLTNTEAVSEKFELDREELERLLKLNLQEEKALRTLISQKREANDDQIARLENLSDEWGELQPDLPILPVLNSLLDWVRERVDTDSIRDVLWNRCPKVLFFDDESRTINSSYALSEQLANSPPKSLQNLSQLAGLDLTELWGAHSQGLQANRDTQIRKANNVLRKEFGIAWNQSDLAVQLQMDAATLSVQIIENDEEVFIFSDRSAGLRMFVALWAFIKSKDLQVKPVLLIDEAELHLHLDAQADLIQMLITQDKVSNVIYTTHSPGCLPPDLGTGVRVVKPSKDNPNLSTISNSFWTSSVGFSPLMMAMGANASAFSAVRYAVLTEGASEMLLLPSLLREANKKEILDYQVAPGLSEAPKKLYPELDLEAARIACVVDSDGGGEELKKQLIKAGFPKDRIVPLGAITLENLLDPVKYAEVVGSLIRETYPNHPLPSLPEFRSISEPWPKVLEGWARPLGIKEPSKTAVASRLVETNNAIPSAKGRRKLKSLHQRLSGILGLDS